MLHFCNCPASSFSTLLLRLSQRFLLHFRSCPAWVSVTPERPSRFAFPVFHSDICLNTFCYTAAPAPLRSPRSVSVTPTQLPRSGSIRFAREPLPMRFAEERPKDRAALGAHGVARPFVAVTRRVVGRSLRLVRRALRGRRKNTTGQWIIYAISLMLSTWRR
jgi:hypothetical protein